MTTPGGPTTAGPGRTTPGQSVVYSQPPPVHNLAVKSEVVPQDRRGEPRDVLATGVTKVENTIDLTRNKSDETQDGTGPSFFVLVSETSLFAGVPNAAGAIDGPAVVAKFNTPSDIVVDRNQQLFIADTDNARIRRISKQGIVSTVAAIGGGDGDIENFPHGLAFDHNGAMYILQSGLKHQIFQVAPGAGVRHLAGTEGKGFADTTTDLLQASFNHPRATGVDSKNRIYIVEKGNNAVRRLDLEKQTVITLVGPGGEPLDLLQPEGVVVDQYDDLFIADTGHHRILKVSFVINPHTGNEETIVSNYVGKYGVPGYANGVAGETLLCSPTGLAVDKMNHLWITDSGNNCVRMMAHGAELLFTISGKGSIEQEKQYNYPTSIALSYDAMYGATISDAAPEAVRNDPNHPLYYSYITPVVFVADSGSHCIRKIHSVLMEPAKALIDVCTPSNDANAEDDYPMHNALSYGILNQRNGLMQVLLQLKPELLQQRDKQKRIPLHIACIESRTATAGTIAPWIIEKMLGQAQPNALSAIMAEDEKGRIPLSYALEAIQEHAINIAMEKAERGDDDEPDVDNPDLPWDASRQLMIPMLATAPHALQHPSCEQFTLHTLIAAGVPLKFLKKFTQAIEDAREEAISEGMLDANFTTLFHLKQECLQRFPNPFFVRDKEGRLPIHVAAQMHQAGTPVALDVLQWLCLVSQLPPQHDGMPPTVRTRDLSLANVVQKDKVDKVEGHFPMFYACTVPRAAAPNAAPGGPQLHRPLHKIPKAQREAIEYMFDMWPEAILQNEAAGVLHSSPFQHTSMKPANFLQWVFYHKSLELLEIFCRKMPGCLDSFVWLDTQDVLTPADSAASEIGRDGRRKRRNSAGPNTLTMLHSAAKINDLELLELLLKSGANPFISDKRDKLPIDWASDDKCKQLLADYMAKDPRKPVLPTPTSEIATQTDEDVVSKEEKAKLEAEAKRLAEKEAELNALLAAEQAARQKAEEEAAKRAQELAETTAKLAADAEAEKARLAAEAEAEKARLAAEAQAEKDRLAQELQAEKDRLAALDAEREAALKAKEAEAEAERQRLAEEAEAERRRLEELDAEREAAKKALEEELRANAEAERQAMEELKARLAQEAEEEKARLAAEAEAERQRLASLDEDREAARKALEEELRAAAEEERARLQAEAEAEKQRLAELDAEREAARKAQEEEMRALDAAREEAKRKMEEQMRLAEEERERARKALEEELRLAAEAEKARLAEELEAEKQRLAALDAEREAAKAAREAEMARLEAEAAERERERQAQNEQYGVERDAARNAAEAAELARIAAEEEARRLREELDKLNADKAAAEAAAAAAEAARKQAEADAEEARRRREHQWNLNAEHEERLRKEQEAALAAAAAMQQNQPAQPAAAPKKKQSAAELAALARAQAAIEAAAAKRNAPKKVLGFGSSAPKKDITAL